MYADDGHDEQCAAAGELPERLGLAGYGGLGLLLVGGLCDGVGGLALASLGVFTVMIAALCFGFLLLTERRGAQR